MAHRILLLATSIVFVLHQPVFAAVFRCTSPDGKTVYQQVPCASGEVKAMDSKARAALKEQERRLEELKRRSLEKESSSKK